VHFALEATFICAINILHVPSFSSLIKGTDLFLLCIFCVALLCSKRIKIKLLHNTPFLCPLISATCFGQIYKESSGSHLQLYFYLELGHVVITLSNVITNIVKQFCFDSFPKRDRLYHKIFILISSLATRVATGCYII